MSEVRFYVPKKLEKEINNLVEKHDGFDSKAAYIVNCIKYFEDNNINNPKGKNNNGKNESIKQQDPISKSVQLIEDIARQKKDDRTIVRDLYTNKLDSEVITFTAYLIEKIKVIFKKTAEIKTTIETTEKYLLSKNDTKSQIKYKHIMEICPKLIKQKLEKEKRLQETKQITESLRQNRQSKIYQYPKPPKIDFIEDELEEITIDDSTKREEEDELTV